MTFSAVENPGKEDQVEDLALGQACSLFWGDHAAVDSLLPNAVAVQPRTVVADLDVDLSAFMEGPQNEAPGRVFPCLDPGFRKLDPMVDGIANQMGQRVLDGLDDGFVEFGLFAFHLDVDLLAAAEGNVAHGAGELTPNIANGLHAGLHYFFLKLGGDEIHALRDGVKPRVLRSIGELQELIPSQH